VAPCSLTEVSLDVSEERKQGGGSNMSISGNELTR
jgi:hypothetical protein